MTRYVKVVTNPENGWDCLIDIFPDIPDSEVYQGLAEDAGKDALTQNEKDVYVIHRKMMRT